MWSFIFLLFVPSAAQVDDPCLEGNYRNITNIYRSTTFKTESPYTPICDDNMALGWYRFNSAAGDKMPESCVDKFMCGTIFPIWMNGAHPTGSTEVLRLACTSAHTPGTSTSTCCAQELDIGVKNCFNQFFIYLLSPTSACDMGYCAGSGVVCPIGQWSKNSNLQPDCKALPVPRISGPVIVDHSFHFNCEIPFNEHDSDLAFEVVWLFDGAEDAQLNSTIIYEPNRIATLDGSFLKGHLNTDVSCQVRGISQTVNLYSPWKESNTSYWAGIRIEPELMKISMADREKNITVTSTLPILCDSKNTEDCVLVFQFAINKSHDVIKAKSACKYTLDMSNWSTTTNQTSMVIPIVASYDPIQGINADAQLTFERLPENGIDGPYFGIFSNFLPNSVQFKVETVPAKVCTLFGDPHITGIKGNRFNLYDVGVYTVFESKYRNFEVQIETWPCNGNRVTCICAVAIREMNDLIRFKGCDHSYYDYSRQSASPELEVVRKGDATVIEQSSDGRQIVIHLPSGAEVSIVSYSSRGGYMDLTLKIPPIDQDHGNGLCGTFDNSSNVLYTLRDGGLDNSCIARGCEPKSFSASWKVFNSSNLFTDNGIPPIVTDTYESKYCTCNNNSQIECALRLSPDTLPCFSCSPVTTNRCFVSPIFPECPHPAKRSDLFEDSDEVILTYNREDYIDFQPAVGSWPTPSGITEQTAERKCRESLERSHLWSYCSHRVEYNQNKIEECKEDIMFGDNSDTLDSVTDFSTLTCQVEMGKDANNYVTTPDGQSVLKPDISTDVCRTDCLRHGHCERGLCVCEEGYAGSNCQLLKDQPPQMIRIRGSTICNTNERPCRRIYIDSYNIERRDTMACKVTEILPNGMAKSTSSFQEAVFISSQKLSCSLPDAQVTTDRAVKTFQVTVTIDGVVYSNALNMTVFDSTCLNCTESGCEQVPSTCFINNLCYLDGDPNPNDVTQICNVNLDEIHWSPVPIVASDYPVILAVDLSGPTNDNVMVCSVNTSDSRATARFKVSWFVNGEAYPLLRELNLPATNHEATFQVGDLPHYGTLVCKIRSYYSDRNILSPYVISNVIDLVLLGVSG